MRYAVITEGTVTNVITLWETNAGDFPGAVALHDRPVGIGDSYQDGKFYRDGEELLRYYGHHAHRGRRGEDDRPL